MANSDDSVLILNAGSSTLKWSLFEGERLAQSDTVSWKSQSERQTQVKSVLSGVPRCAAVGHRIVHGGTAFDKAVVIDASVRTRLDELVQLDRLHMEPALQIVDLAIACFPGIPQVAAFDTAFHSTLAPDTGYALPFEWTERWGLQRFGFHGLSVAYCVERVAQLMGRIPDRIIVCHLGSGCSITAVREGRSVDTTMGFTPLEGLMMATRCGSIDPGLFLHLQRECGVSIRELEEALAQRSGLLGVSGASGDLRQVRAAAAQGSARAQLACRMFERSARRFVGSMVGVLGGVDVIVFAGGIGENDGRIRSEIADAVGADRLVLEAALDDASAADRRISAANSPAAAFVIRTREDLKILAELREAISTRGYT